MIWWLALVLTSVLSVALSAGVRPLLNRFHVVDVPNDRSSHSETTPRGGGLALLAIMILTGIIWLILGAKPPLVGWIIAGASLLGGLGLLEDMTGLSISLRLTSQAVIALLLSTGIVETMCISWILLAPLAACGVFLVNAANFMDGVNGISSLHGVILGGTTVAVAIFAQSPPLAVIGAVATGLFLGFLPWNFPRARIFLGDSGSYLLGALAWLLGCWTWRITGSILVGAAPVTIYATDVVLTLIRRARRGKNLAEAHRDHTYQAVQRATGSHMIPAIGASVMTASVCAASILAWQIGQPLVGWVAALILCVVYQALGLWVGYRRTVGHQTPSPS